MENGLGLDLDALDPDGWEQLAAECERRIAQLRAVQLGCLQRLDRAQVATADGARTLPDWVSARLDVSHHTAATLVRTARRLSYLPHLTSVLTAGQASFDRVAVVASYATPRDEQHAVEESYQWHLTALARRAARHHRISRQDEQHSAREDHFLVIQPDLFSHRWKLWGRLTATDGALVEHALETRADQLPDLPHGREPRAQRLATALVSISQDSLDTPLPTDHTPRNGGPELTIFVDAALADATGGEAGAELLSGARVGPQTLEEILCVGKVGVLKHLPDGTLIRVGDHTQAIPPAVRRYVFYRHGGVCSVEGCTSRYRLQPHHRRHRSHGGDNHPDNLPLACWYHHHRAIHQLGYRIDPQSPPGRIRLLPPERQPPQHNPP